MSSKINTGACGDNCSVCPRYIATKHDGNAELVKVKDLWVHLGWRDADTEAHELQCDGCSKETPCAYKELRDCVFRKGYTNCGMCKEYPCTHVKAVFMKTDKILSEIKALCTPATWSLLVKAFGKKREYLNCVHKEHFENAL